MSQSEELDKYYTDEATASWCYAKLLALFPETEGRLFLEPAAGAGAFSRLPERCAAYDLAPEAEGIKQADFLKLHLKNAHFITLGNPPFGRRNRLALAFFQACAPVSDVIAFILPLGFAKYSVQKQLPLNWELVFSQRLDKQSYTLDRHLAAVGCLFQIWVKKESLLAGRYPDLRAYQKAPIAVAGLKLYQHNATPGSRKYADYDWDRAYYRQGYKDYSHVFYARDREFIRQRMAVSSDQFFFVRIENPALAPVVDRMDLTALADRGTTVPGFGKADYVEAFLALQKQMKIF